MTTSAPTWLGSSSTVLSVEIEPAAVRRWREAFPAWRDSRLLGLRDPTLDPSRP
jgi:hypothetical protein